MSVASGTTIKKRNSSSGIPPGAKIPSTWALLISGDTKADTVKAPAGLTEATVVPLELTVIDPAELLIDIPLPDTIFLYSKTYRKKFIIYYINVLI